VNPRSNAPGAGPVPLTPLADVSLRVSVLLGQTQLTVRELMQIQPGAVLPLDAVAGEPVTVMVNGSPVARGEIVMVNERFGVRLTELLDKA
jgi:flagellar motor switch protein FliN